MLRNLPCDGTEATAWGENPDLEAWPPGTPCATSSSTVPVLQGALDPPTRPFQRSESHADGSPDQQALRPGRPRPSWKGSLADALKASSASRRLQRLRAV